MLDSLYVLVDVCHVQTGPYAFSVFFGVITMLLHHSLDFSPASSLMSSSSHLTKCWSNLSFSGIKIFLCFWTRPSVFGSTCNFTFTPLSFPMPLKIHLHTPIRFLPLPVGFLPSKAVAFLSLPLCDIS